MSSFHFSMEQVLRYRKQLEDQAMQFFAQAVQARDSRLREKEELETALDQARKKMAGQGFLDADERWLLNNYMVALASDIELARADLSTLEETVDRARTDLTLKAQNRKLLERLKEKQANRHKMAENHKENKYYDDIATIRFTLPAV